MSATEVNTVKGQRESIETLFHLSHQLHSFFKWAIPGLFLFISVLFKQLYKIKTPVGFEFVSLE